MPDPGHRRADCRGGASLLPATDGSDPIERKGFRRGRAVSIASITTGVAVGVEVVLFLVGIDLRRVPDVMAEALAFVAWAAVIALLVLSPGRRWTRAVGRSAAGLVVVFSVWLLIALGDLKTWFVFVGFLVALLGPLVVAGALVAVVAAVVRRRGRVRALLAVAVTAELVAMAVSAIVFLNPRPPSAPTAFADGASLDSYLEELTATGSPPSVTAVVVKDGQTVYSNAFGLAYAPGHAPASVDTVDKWWSVTKLVTAVAVLQLAEQGRLRLDQPVRQLLPSFVVEPERWAGSVTVADLLNHSAGLPNNVPAVVAWMHLDDEPALDQTRVFEDRFGSFARLDRQPGQLGVYSNVDYMVLGALIEQISGESYEQYVTEHVLQPLGMVHTGFGYSGWMRAHEGVGSHPAANIQTLFLPLVDPPWPTSFIRTYDDGTIWFNRFVADCNPPTGLIGPAPEMMRLARAILNGGQLDGRRILSVASVETMLTSHHVPAGASSELSATGNGDVRHGVGWFVVRHHGRLYHEHRGGGPGWTALMRLYPDENLAIVVMGNGTLLPATDLVNAIASTPW